jgi:2-methylisocitrate lyase-like PEP mutase family enzyme
VIPNPWDIGSAKYLASVGFRALATTSAGMAHSLGLPDGKVGLQAVLDHIASIVAATDLPVNADFENGFADDPESVATNVRRCIETGVAGLSIEDSTGEASAPLYDLPLAVARIEAARKAIDASGADVMLTARAENFVVGRPDLDDALARLRAYRDAGAEVLYAPGPRKDEDIARIVEAAGPLPVNVLAFPPMTTEGLGSLGVRRISLGSHLSRVAWAGFAQAAQELAETGSFSAVNASREAPDLNALFGTVSA